MENKYYSLLRPFDMEAAKRGEAICWNDGEDEGLVYVSGPDHKKNICYLFEGKFFLCNHTFFRMAPLCWVEGKPVYKGDTLYNRCGKKRFVDRVEDNSIQKGAIYATDGYWDDPQYLTWTKPKVKREWWVNVYKSRVHCFKYETKEFADNSARFDDGTIDPDRIACVRIEWEE